MLSERMHAKSPPSADVMTAGPPPGGWRAERGEPSLSEVFGSVRVAAGASFWRKLVAFLGPGYLVAVGYMDPGNWATSLPAAMTPATTKSTRAKTRERPRTRRTTPSRRRFTGRLAWRRRWWLRRGRSPARPSHLVRPACRAPRR